MELNGVCLVGCTYAVNLHNNPSTLILYIYLGETTSFANNNIDIVVNAPKADILCIIYSS